MDAVQTSHGFSRSHWIDNLRTITIFLVVLYHVGGVYEGAGLWGWFWIVDDPDTMVWVGIMGIVFDIFMMPVLFFLSGYLAPASLDRQSPAQFVLGKARRLIVPWFVAVLTLIPLYKVIFLYSRGLPQEHWGTYFHVTNPNSQNWLWFLPLLFAFNLVYVLFTRLPSTRFRIPTGGAIALALVAALAWSIIVGGLTGFRSWTLTPLLDFENERLLVYLFSFALGAMLYKRGSFETPPKGRWLYYAANGLAWIPVTAHIIVRLVPFLVEGFTMTPVYRLLWWISFDLSLLVMVYLMVESFRRYFDRTGPVWSALNRASYGVYIVHVILIGVFGTLLMKAGLPVYVKYPVLVLSTWVGSNLLVLAYSGARRRGSRTA
ncbi:MAG: acyltransferase family protein [Xanthomonadales bacterium]|nr:acyltransferase family protein [Xanthomonadales bacterium]